MSWNPLLIVIVGDEQFPRTPLSPQTAFASSRREAGESLSASETGESTPPRSGRRENYRYEADLWDKSQRGTSAQSRPHTDEQFI